MKTLAQGTSANVHVGPLLNVSASVMVGLAIDNDAIVLIPEGGASTARSDTTSAASIGPGMYRVVLNASDTATLGQLDVLVSGSGAMLFRETVQIWQSPTHALFFGSADTIATSAGVSAIVTVAVAQALSDYDVASSADVSAIVTVAVAQALSDRQVPSSAAVSGIVIQALTDYDVPTSADVSAIGTVVAAQALSDYAALVSANLSAGVDAVLVQRGLHMVVDVSASVAGIHDNSIIGMTWASASADAFDRTSDSLAALADSGVGITSAQASTIMAGVLADYDVPTSADVSAIASAVVAGALTDADLATSADVSAVVSTVVAQAITDADLATSADVSAVVSVVVAGALTNADLATSADVSVIVSAVLNSFGVASAGELLTSAQISAIGAQVLTDYDAPTSADISAIVGPAVWSEPGTEPASAPEWASVNRGQGFDWLLARSLNRHSQTATEIQIFTSAGAAIASASAGNNSTSAVRDQFLG